MKQTRIRIFCTRRMSCTRTHTYMHSRPLLAHAHARMHPRSLLAHGRTYTHAYKSFLVHRWHLWQHTHAHMHAFKVASCTPLTSVTGADHKVHIGASGERVPARGKQIQNLLPARGRHRAPHWGKKILYLFIIILFYFIFEGDCFHWLILL